MEALLFVDRSQFMVDTMVSILKSRPDIKLIAVTANIDEAFSRIDECTTLIVSAALPGQRALALITKVRRMYPSVRIVVMDIDRAGMMAQEYLRAGATVCAYEEDTIADLLELAAA